jgi:hypothetical protein
MIFRDNYMRVGGYKNYYLHVLCETHGCSQKGMGKRHKKNQKYNEIFSQLGLDIVLINIQKYMYMDMHFHGYR